jgi:hypothetical protein
VFESARYSNTGCNDLAVVGSCTGKVNTSTSGTGCCSSTPVNDLNDSFRPTPSSSRAAIGVHSLDAATGWVRHHQLRTSDDSPRWRTGIGRTGFRATESRAVPLAVQSRHPVSKTSNPRPAHYEPAGQSPAGRLPARRAHPNALGALGDLQELQPCPTTHDLSHDRARSALRLEQVIRSARHWRTVTGRER